MYFVMKDHSKSDIDKISVYVEELPMELGCYDSFRLTCVETMETIIVRTIPTDNSRKTKSVVFHGLEEYDSVHIIVDYMLIGDSDYTFLGNYMFDVEEKMDLRGKEMIIGDDNVAILHKGSGMTDGSAKLYIPKIEVTETVML